MALHPPSQAKDFNSFETHGESSLSLGNLGPTPLNFHTIQIWKQQFLLDIYID